MAPSWFKYWIASEDAFPFPETESDPETASDPGGVWRATKACPVIATVNVHSDAPTFPLVLEGDDVWIDLGDGKGYRPVCTDEVRRTNAQHEYACEYDPLEIVADDRTREWEEAEEDGDGWSCGWTPTGQRRYDVRIVGNLRVVAFDVDSFPEIDGTKPTRVVAVRWTTLPVHRDAKRA